MSHVSSQDWMGQGQMRLLQRQHFPHTSTNQVTFAKQLLWCTPNWLAKGQVCAVVTGFAVVMAANGDQNFPVGQMEESFVMSQPNKGFQPRCFVCCPPTMQRRDKGTCQRGCSWSKHLTLVPNTGKKPLQWASKSVQFTHRATEASNCNHFHQATPS